MSMEDLTFEQAMQRLEEIVSLLEDGKAPLNESMALFEEGTKLSAYLSQLLDTGGAKGDDDNRTRRSRDRDSV